MADKNPIFNPANPKIGTENIALYILFAIAVALLCYMLFSGCCSCNLGGNTPVRIVENPKQGNYMYNVMDSEVQSYLNGPPDRRTVYKGGKS